MKLKSLEISGFKSFSDFTKIEFLPGLTGIVGPTEVVRVTLVKPSVGFLVNNQLRASEAVKCRRLFLRVQQIENR